MKQSGYIRQHFKSGSASHTEKFASMHDLHTFRVGSLISHRKIDS